MKKLPFYSRSTQMVIVNFLCRCGCKWTDHDDDIDNGEIHGGECARIGCRRFTFAGYMYEQAKIDHEYIQQEAADRLKCNTRLSKQGTPM